MKTYNFKSPSPVPMKIAADVTPTELARALTGTHLTVSNWPGGGFIIHRLPLGIDRAPLRQSCDAPPEPPRAA